MMPSHLSEWTLGSSWAADILSRGPGALGRKAELSWRCIWADLYMQPKFLSVSSIPITSNRGEAFEMNYCIMEINSSHGS